MTIVVDRALNDPAIVEALRELGQVITADRQGLGISDRLSDEQIITELRTMKDVIFVTPNEDDFWLQYDAIPNACIVTVNTRNPCELLALLKDFTRAAGYNTHAKRNARIVRLRDGLITDYQVRARKVGRVYCLDKRCFENTEF